MTLPSRNPKRPTGSQRPAATRRSQRFAPPAKKSNTGMVVGIVVGVVIVLGLIIGVVSGSKKSGGPRPGPVAHQEDTVPPTSGGVDQPPKMSAEDDQALREAFSQSAEADKIFNKFSGTSGSVTVSGTGDLPELEQCKELYSSSMQTLERLGNKYNYQFGEGTRTARRMKAVNSALRELRSK